MPIYARDYCYAKLLAEFQEFKRVQTGDSVFDTSHVVKVITPLSTHLSILLKAQEKHKIERELSYLSKIDRSGKTWFSRFIDKNRKHRQKEGYHAQPFIDAYTFFYRLSQRDTSYFSEVFDDVFTHKDKIFQTDFMEFANLIALKHLATLRSEIERDGRLEYGTYLKSMAYLEEKRKSKLEKKYSRLIKKYNNDIFTESQCHLAKVVVHVYAADVFFAKKNRKSVLLTLIGEGVSTRSSALPPKLEKDEGFSTAFNVLTNIVGRNTKGFLAVFPDKLPAIKKPQVSLYIDFMRQMLLPIFKSVANSLALSPAHSSVFDRFISLNSVDEGESPGPSQPPRQSKRKRATNHHDSSLLPLKSIFRKSPKDDDTSRGERRVRFCTGSSA